MEEEAGQTVIDSRNLTKSFGEGRAKTHALRGVDLRVYEGELLMIEGPSGCGKTTLLSVLSGTLKPDSGTVNVLGQSIESATPDALSRFRSRHLGFVFQLFNLIPTISVWENVSVPLLIQGKPQAEARELSHRILEQVGLLDLAGKSPNRLSGGQQQRVAFARALVHQPEIIVCDEPTSALDGPTGERIMTVLKKLTSANKATVVVVTHDIRIHRFADRIIQMEDGQILNSVKG